VRVVFHSEASTQLNVDAPQKNKDPFPRLVALVVWVLAIGATFGGVYYGLPPKEGPVTTTIWWFPIALLLYPVVPGRELGGLLLVLIQFPMIATLMTLGFRKWPVNRVVVCAIVSYLAAVVACTITVKLTGMGEI
jgi:hypothetical protein